MERWRSQPERRVSGSTGFLLSQAVADSVLPPRIHAVTNPSFNIDLLADCHRHPDWGSNTQPFGVQDDTPSNRAPWAGLNLLIVESIRSKEKLEVPLVYFRREKVWNPLLLKVQGRGVCFVPYLWISPRDIQIS